MNTLIKHETNMKEVSQALKVALSIRQYLQENTRGRQPSSRELNESYKRITNQIKNINDL